MSHWFGGGTGAGTTSSADGRDPTWATARAALDRGDPAAALEALRPGLDSGEAAAPARLLAGLAHAAQGNAAAARDELLAAAGFGLGLRPDEWPELVRSLLTLAPTPEDLALVSAGLETAVEAEPEAAEVYLARGLVYRAAGQAENAINEFDYAAELSEDLAEAWLALAECELAQGRPMDAADALDHAADLDPNEIDLFVRMGDALLEAGDPARAIHAYEEGLELAPESVALYAGRARASLAMQLYEDAAEDARRIIAHDPADALGFALLGQAEYQLGHDDPAIEAFSHALERDATLVVALRTRGDAYWARRDYSAAARDYAAAAALEPEDAELALCLAEARFEQGDLAAALAGATAAVVAEPDLADGYILAARVQRKQGDLAAARETLERGLEAVADESELYVQRAHLHRAAGHAYLAWRDLRWAIDLDPGNGEAYVMRAQLALDLEGPDEAIADLDAALEIDPEDGSAYAWRGRAQSLAGRHDAAEEDWSEADALLPPGDALRDEIVTWRWAAKES
jgi:tetratricopeptide (TPR) repeat protein